MNDKRTEIPLLLFAKTPVAGKVKTRLQPSCSGSQAADIAKILIEESIRKAVSCWDGRVLLSVWPDRSDAFIRALADTYSIQLVSQVNGDLGEKMFAAFERHGYPAAILGCDAPHVCAAVLRQAHTNLAAGNSVLAGSRDGGYYLIGLAESCPALFTGIEWGTDKVLDATLRLAQQQSLGFRQLAVLNDVDTWQDLLEVSQQLPELRCYLVENRLLEA